MKKAFSFSFAYLILFSSAIFAEDIVGFWKTIDDYTGKPQSIIAIYEYQNKHFGRIIATYNDDGKIKDTIYHPTTRAPGVVGDPYYVGMDIIWDLRPSGSKYTGGSILDPEKGNIYGAEAWRDGDNLIVRGELIFIGRNQTWLPVSDNDFPPGFVKPDLKTLVPVIPTVKD